MWKFSISESFSDASEVLASFRIYSQKLIIHFLADIFHLVEVEAVVGAHAALHVNPKPADGQMGDVAHFFNHIVGVDAASKAKMHLLGIGRCSDWRVDALTAALVEQHGNVLAAVDVALLEQTVVVALLYDNLFHRIGCDVIDWFFLAIAYVKLYALEDAEIMEQLAKWIFHTGKSAIVQHSPCQRAAEVSR